MQYENLTRAIIGCSMIVQRGLGPGFLESVYQNALAWELRSANILVDCERRLQVRYREVVVGDFVADMVIADRVLVEIKAVRALAPAHEAQLVNYLAATGMEVGLLINFGAARLSFKRRTRVPRQLRSYRMTAG